MKKIILTLALAAVAAVCANAQIGVGVGYASTTLKGDNTTTNLGGLTFGASYNIPLVNGLAVAPGIQFAMQNYKEDANTIARRITLLFPCCLTTASSSLTESRLFPILAPPSAMASAVLLQAAQPHSELPSALERSASIATTPPMHPSTSSLAAA